ncbi:MBL fold metallo-hydrolase [Salinibacillus xinjiangensis]|uniref:MBL fold metallo-hydrolase n=1 Tax=Salinibacillus xinjiangensis TaxID=1229268 RepID=UPI002B2683C3|nr:MBL fold metallo-hydrolase [Salinibacillus xinjiangensis]
MTEHIHRLVVRYPFAMQETNCYLIKGERGYTVVDTGAYSEESLGIWQKLLDTGITVEKVVLTHTHEDHLGLAKWFQEEIGIPVYTTELGYMEMKKRRATDAKAKVKQMIQQHGGPYINTNKRDDSFIYDFEPDGFFQKDGYIELGDESYEVIWTPGHAPDHFCFYHRESKVMIAGDHILKEFSPVIGLWSGEESNALHDYFQALEWIQAYPADIALPGHGGLIENVQERVNEIHTSHKKRLEQVLSFVLEESKSVHEVTEEIYGSGQKLYVSQFMATLTRFIYLESIGKVKREETAGIIKFRAL